MAEENKNSSGTANIKVMGGSSFRLDDERVKKYRHEWDQRPKTYDKGEFPLHLDIESTSRCNLRCKFCATVHADYIKGDLSVELNRKIMDEGQKYGLCAAKYNWRGEPLLNKDIFQIISDAKSSGLIDVFFNSNATLLTEEKARKLIESGLDRLIVSFEGFEKELYESNRVNANFEKTVSNIRGFRAIRDSLGKETPKLRLQTVGLPELVERLDEYREFWLPYADEVTCIDLRDEEADYSQLESEFVCPYLFLRLTVSWNGKVYPCPFVEHSTEKDENALLGDINQGSLYDIWHGDKLENLRQMHIAGKANCCKPCSGCSYRGTEVLKQGKS